MKFWRTLGSLFVALGICPLVAAVPLLNDGSLVRALEFRMPTTAGKTTWKSAVVSLKGSSDPSDVSEIALWHDLGEGKKRFPATTEIGGQVTLTGEMTFGPGNHLFYLMVKLKPGADLSHVISLEVEAMVDSKGKTHIPADAKARQRLAYPMHHRGQFDCHTFRIPGIARAKDGALLAVYDMRYDSSRDLQGHMDIGLSRSDDGGQTWADPVPIMDMGKFGGKPEKENGCSDPCILVDGNTGEIFVFAVWTYGRPGTHQWRGAGSGPGFEIEVASQFMMVRSKDHGKTWTRPENLTKALKNPAWHLFAPAPGNGITMKDGTLVLPTQGRDEKGEPFSNFTYSKDHGVTWQVSTAARHNTTECAVAELGEGSLMLNIRDNRNRKDKSDTNGRAVATTNDLGKTWAVHSTDHGALPEPTCMASMIRHEGLLLFSNPNHKSRRTNITLRASSDDGETWPHELLLDSAGTGYGYSSLVMIDDETVGILYESSQADMIFQKITLKELLQR